MIGVCHFLLLYVLDQSIEVDRVMSLLLFGGLVDQSLIKRI